jgi:hypothetical protein
MASDKGYFLIFFISEVLHCFIGESYPWGYNNILWERKISKKFRFRAIKETNNQQNFIQVYIR